MDAPDRNTLLSLLPQIHCGRCGFDGCIGYADAMSKGETHTLCSPGGHALAKKLAAALNRDTGELPQERPFVPVIPHITAENCTGCSICLERCPVDAIAGLEKKRHAVIEALCSGCGICADTCPVSAITVSEKPGAGFPDRETAKQLTARHRRHLARALHGSDLPDITEPDAFMRSVLEKAAGRLKAHGISHDPEKR